MSDLVLIAPPRDDADGHGPMLAQSRGISLTLDIDQLDALGISIPEAGEPFAIRAEAIVSHSSTSDPDTDGNTESACVVLTLTSLTLDADGSRYASNTRTMYGGPGGLDPDGGGTTGPFGKLNAPVGG